MNANKKKLIQLIESIVDEALLKEQDIVADDPMLKIFVEPFTDVIKTANAEIKKNLTNIRGNVKSLVKQAAILAIPFLSIEMIKDTHKNAQKEIQGRLAKIDQEYADVYARNWDTMQSRDIWGITFMLNPAMGITSKFAMKAPTATLKVLETLTAGALSPENEQRLERAKQFAAKFSGNIAPNYGGGGGGGGFGGGGGGGFGVYADSDGDGFGDGGGGMGESVDYMTEQPAQQAAVQQTPQPQQQKQQKAASQSQQPSQEDQMKKLVAFIEAFKKQPDVQQALQNGKVAQELRQGAFAAVMATAAPVLKAATFDQLSQAIGPEMKKYEAQVQKDMPKDMSPEEQMQYKEALVPEIKAVYKQVLATQLGKQSTGDKVADKNLQQVIAQINKA